MNLYTQRFRAVSQAGPLARHTFRVVDADNKDMLLWSEIGTGGGSGVTWRGTLKEFRQTFGVVKASAG